MLTKLFIGYQLTHTLKAHIISEETAPLQIIPHEGKHYIGLYSNDRSLPLKDLKKIKETIQHHLQEIAPSLYIEQQECLVFSELFLG